MPPILPPWASDGSGQEEAWPLLPPLEDAVPPDPGLPILVPRLPDDVPHRSSRFEPRTANTYGSSKYPYPHASETSPLLYPMGPSQAEPTKQSHWKLLFLVFFFLSWVLAAAAVLFLYMDRYLFL